MFYLQVMNAIRAALLSLLLSQAAHAAPGDPRRTPIVEAVERATPAVVTILVRGSGGSLFGVQRGPSESEGSGVIVGSDGVIVTNAHVVEAADTITVHLTDGRTFPGTVVAADRSIDLAVVRVSGASGLPTLPLGNSDDLLLGEPAIAIGNPYGLGLTVSTGVVASTGRDVDAPGGGKQTYIQTDAAINPGNSGGALVNARGELIGINTFVHSAGEGIGFAIPVNRARKITGDLLIYGAVQLPWLGVDLMDRSATRTAAPTVAVARVYEGGPSQRSGLRVGDTVVEVSGH
ncbi:MAG TPA: trypsin-like peptidase domain-containing protein, partial [Microthrixaceae bacterium]|nr:trypsin-like peptidase domain-containing protein [Microthrixaceae bacterium]